MGKKYGLLKTIALSLVFLVLFTVTFIFITCIVWTSRHNTSYLNPGMQIHSWYVTNDNQHNAFTDMIQWNGSFYLVFRTAYSHISHKSRLILLKSGNARNWRKCAQFSLENEDIRDPKLAVIQDRLFLYALKNRSFTAFPYTTIVTSSSNGIDWSAWTDVEPQGWILWRPKSSDLKTWYTAATSKDRMHTQLLRSIDGIYWSTVSDIYKGQRHSETAISFQTDSTITGTVRVEGSGQLFGSPDACTLIFCSQFPFLNWKFVTDYTTRLDGPALFKYQGYTYAAGRYEPGRTGPANRRGGQLSRKRTALFRVFQDSLSHMTDLPSCGDTSYPGVVATGDSVLISYYTSDIQEDYPWLLGSLKKTQIRIACLYLDESGGMLR